jgi:chromosome partitioning protein
MMSLGREAAMARAAKKNVEAAEVVPNEDIERKQSVQKALKSASPAVGAPAKRRTFVLAVTNLKGGVAKTTTACNVGWGMVDAGLTCLIVDLDMQANATSDLGFDIAQVQENGLSMASVLRGQNDLDDILLQYSDTNLWIAPSAKALTDVERQLSTEIGGEKRLSQKLNAVRERFDVIIFDCGPNLNLLTINALSMADFLIIPVQTEYLAAHGTLSLLDTVSQVRDNYNPGLTILPILPTMFSERNSQEQATLGELRQLVSDIVPIFDPVPRATVFSKASASGHPALRASGRSKAVGTYRNYVKMILSKMKVAQTINRQAD